jgi:prepilin-type N-terminal cleavage/methylation domain-containing protein
MSPVTRPATRSAFSLVELLVVMTLLSLIVLALMAVFDSTQRAFRASVTQTDVLEGSRAAVDLITTDLRAMTPSGGSSNWVSGTVNFFEFDNNYLSIPSVAYLPLQQSLPGSVSGAPRVNVLNYFFLLGRENTKWTGVGYVVNANSASPLYPLYRFYAEANIATPPYSLYAAFTNAVYYAQWTNMSHVQDGVVHLTVRPFDTTGYRMTNTALIIYPSPNGRTNFHDNAWFTPFPSYGEVGFYMFSNMVPACVELQMGVLEDRALARAESFGNNYTGRSNYLSQQSGHVHLFRQRVTIPNVDPSAYQ